MLFSNVFKLVSLTETSTIIDQIVNTTHVVHHMYYRDISIISRLSVNNLYCFILVSLGASLSFNLSKFAFAIYTLTFHSKACK